MKTFYEYKDAVLDSDLTCEQKMVAIVIASHFNWENFNHAFPGLKRIAQKASVSVSTVTRCKRVLEAQGWLTQKRRHDSTNVYFPAIPEVAHAEHAPSTYGHTDHTSGEESGENEGPMVTVTNTYGQPDHTLWSQGPPNSEVNSEVKNEDNAAPGAAVQEAVDQPSLAVHSDDSLSIGLGESSFASETPVPGSNEFNIGEEDFDVFDWDIDEGIPNKPVEASVRNTTVQATPAVAEAVRIEPVDAPGYTTIKARTQQIGAEQKWTTSDINDTADWANNNKEPFDGDLDALIHLAYKEKW